MRSSSLSGMPRDIFSMLAGEWKSSASANSHLSCAASSLPTVVFPDPAGPMRRTITGRSSPISAAVENARLLDFQNRGISVETRGERVCALDLFVDVQVKRPCLHAREVKGSKLKV